MKKLLILATALVGAGSVQAQIVINATNVAFTDISGTGTALAGTADDSETVISGTSLSSAGFTGNWLLAGGVDVRVGNNGGIIWGNSNGDPFTNASEVGFTNSATFLTMAAAESGGAGNGGLGPRQFLAVY